MSETLFIEGGRVIDPASGVDGVRTVVVRDGKIAEVAERLERPRDARPIDDPHVSRAQLPRLFWIERRENMFDDGVVRLVPDNKRNIRQSKGVGKNRRQSKI